jgi:hypothetical protein
MEAGQVLGRYREVRIQDNDDVARGRVEAFEDSRRLAAVSALVKQLDVASGMVPDETLDLPDRSVGRPAIDEDQFGVRAQNRDAANGVGDIPCLVQARDDDGAAVVAGDVPARPRPISSTRGSFMNPASRKSARAGVSGKWEKTVSTPSGATWSCKVRRSVHGSASDSIGIWSTTSRYVPSKVDTFDAST